MDSLKAFAYSTLEHGISAIDTHLSFAVGEGARFPASNFNVVVWDAEYPDAARAYQDGKAEIVRVTSRIGDSALITRAQEGTTARAFNSTNGVYNVELCVTPKLFTDMEPALGNPGEEDQVLASTTDGERSWVTVPASEPPLGNPATTGFVLSSTNLGVRSWISPDVYQVMCASAGGSFNAIKYGTFGFMTLIAADYAKMVFPTAVVMDRLYALCYSSSSGNIAAGYARIIKNGVETLLSANWVDGGVASDLVNSVSFAAGDTVSIIYHPGTGTVDNAVISVRVKIV